MKLAIITKNAMRGMPKKKTIVVIIGTRPEAIKMAPVILELRKYRNKVSTIVVSINCST